MNSSRRAEDEDATVDNVEEPEPKAANGVGISVDTFTNMVGFFFPEFKLLSGPTFDRHLLQCSDSIFQRG